MGHWNYRIAKKNNELAVYSFYYDEEGNIKGSAEQPAIVLGENLDEIQNQLNLMKDALKKDIVDLD